MTHVDFKGRKKNKKKIKIIHGRNRRQLFDERKEGFNQRPNTFTWLE